MLLVRKARDSNKKSGSNPWVCSSVRELGRPALTFKIEYSSNNDIYGNT